MESLTQSGWVISSDWKPSGKNVLKEALDTDLKDFGDPFLADAVSAANGERVFKVPSQGIVLQISKLRNVAAPKVNEESGVAPRLLKISLSDGHTSMHCVEMNKLDKLSLTTPPGTKIRLLPNQTIPFINGYLQLRQLHFELLGGKVEALVEKWEIGRELAHFTRAKHTDSAGGPPTWVPFGKRIAQTLAVDKNFKALGGSDGGKQQDEKDTTKDAAEFDSQRQDAIKEASKEGNKKVFGGGKAEIKEAKNVRRNQQRSRENNSFKEGSNGSESTEIAEENHRGGGGRRGGKRGRRNDDDYDQSYGQANPTIGVSLFDFVEKEFPGAHEERAKPEKSKDVSNPTSYYASERRDRENRERGGGRGDHGGGGGRGDHGGGGGGRGGNKRQDANRKERGGGRQDRGGRRSDGRQDERADNSANIHQRGGQRNARDSNGGRINNNFNENQRSRYRDDGERRNQQGPRHYEDPQGGHGQQEHSGRGSQHQQRNQRSKFQGSDRDFGEWNSSTYHNASDKNPPHYHQDQRRNQQQHQGMQESFEAMSLKQRTSGPEQRSQRGQGRNGPPPPIQDNQHFHAGGLRGQQQQQQLKNTNGIDVPKPGNQHQSFQPPPPPTAIPWKEGMMCMAKYWEDGRYYVSQITALTANTAVVHFKEYGNHEEVLLMDLKPMTSHSVRSGGQFIPATPGLPPAFPIK